MPLPATRIRRVVVLQAGLRSPSTTRMLADELTREVRARLERAGLGAEVGVIDIRDHAHGIADALLTGFAPEGLQAALDQTAGADALVVVTPTFSASYSGMFKAFVDVIEPGALTGKPVLLAATGGTERHSLMIDHALRPLFAYLGAEPVRTGVFAATSDFGGGEGHLVARVRRAVDELVARLEPVMVAEPGRPSHAEASAPSTPAAPTLPRGFGDDLVPFEQMMNNFGVGR